MGTPGASAETLARIHAIVHPVVGQRAWGVALGYASFVTMEFGSPREKDGHTHGEWHLWVYGCTWRLEEPGQVLAASEDERERLAEAVKRLEGLVLQRVEVLPPGLDTILTFAGGVVLRLFAVYSDTDGMEHWMLWTPDGNILSVGPGTTWRHSPASEP